MLVNKLFPIQFFSEYTTTKISQAPKFNFAVHKHLFSL